MKIPDGLQYEVWVPTQPGEEFPKGYRYIGFDRDAAIAAADEAISEGVKPEHLMLVVGLGFDTYEITPEDLRDKT